ncbi:type II restriction endonuclease [Clostridium perfringens]
MKNLEFYTQKNLNTKEEVFQYLLSTLKESIFTWDYFTDFKKAISNVDKIKNELLKLNALLGVDNQVIDDKFLEIVTKYPKIRKILPCLIALRADKLNSMNIIDDLSNLTSQNKKHLFNEKVELTDEYKLDLLKFFNLSGLREFFINKEVSSLVDYLKGVEVGMDTNGRKNRTGTSMETLCEEFVKSICLEKGFEYIVQATKAKILSRWGVKLELEKIDRRFDFAIFDKKNNKLTLIEVNFYSSSGSKLKATAGEYKELYDYLSSQNHRFIWITDGMGWISSKASLFETFINDDYIFNLKMISDGILNEVI